MPRKNETKIMERWGDFRTRTNHDDYAKPEDEISENGILLRFSLADLVKLGV